MLACELDGEGMKLMRHLQRTRATVRHVWPTPSPLGGNADVVIVEYAKELSRSVIWDPGEASAALIVLLPQGSQYDLVDLRKSLPDAVLYRPYHAPAIDVALMLALDHFSYGKRQRMRIARLDENIKAMRDIEEAFDLAAQAQRVAATVRPRRGKARPSAPMRKGRRSGSSAPTSTSCR